MDVEFLDPGPDQPYGPGEGVPAPPSQRRRPERELVGLLIMLVAAALLPVIASFQAVYTVRASTDALTVAYAADGWGRYTESGLSGIAPAAHEPRFGVLLAVCGTGFAVLALLLLARGLGAGAPVGRSTARAAAGAAGTLTGVLVGVTASMTLQIETVFDRLRNSLAGPFGGAAEIRLGVGPAVWLCLAGVLAGGLAVTAALRLRRLDAPPPVPSGLAPLR